MVPDFVKYVSLLKTIRGILLTGSCPSEKIVSWLRRSIRWRPIGAGSTCLEILRRCGVRSKLILEATYPFAECGELVDLLAEVGVDKNLSEAIVLASIYIVPIVLLDVDTINCFRELDMIVHEIRTQKRLSDREIKLHMRIAEYSVKDYHFDMISRAEDAILRGGLTEEVKRRTTVCKRDAKRYWRIREDRGRSIIFYIDPLRPLQGKENAILSLVRKNRGIILALGMPVAVAVPEMLSD